MTNGDNEYASSFFSRIGEVKEADIVAVDFYSRYQRMTSAQPTTQYLTRSWQESDTTEAVRKHYIVGRGMYASCLCCFRYPV